MNTEYDLLTFIDISVRRQVSIATTRPGIIRGAIAVSTGKRMTSSEAITMNTSYIYKHHPVDPDSYTVVVRGVADLYP